MRYLFAVLAVSLVGQSANADEFLTFVIDGNQSGPGMIIITGNFDVQWGLTTFSGPNQTKRYGKFEVRPITPQEKANRTFGANPRNAVIIIERKDSKSPSHTRIHARFLNTNDNHFQLFECGQGIVINDLKAAKKVVE